MGTSSDQVRADIEATREKMSADVDQLVDRISPKRMMQRRRGRLRGATSGLRKRVAGTGRHRRSDHRHDALAAPPAEPTALG